MRRGTPSTHMQFGRPSPLGSFGQPASFPRGVGCCLPLRVTICVADHSEAMHCVKKWRMLCASEAVASKLIVWQ